MATASNLITDPNKLADAGLVHYSGDRSTLNHGGFWYETHNWEENGYASAIEVCPLDDGPCGAVLLVVRKLTIHKPKDMSQAFAYCGIEEKDQGNIHAQVAACKGYGYYDPDESDWREASSYSFLILDHEEGPEDFAKYAKVHNATIAPEGEVWELLGRLVGRELLS
jgi:hypothetical protein